MSTPPKKAKKRKTVSKLPSKPPPDLAKEPTRREAPPCSPFEDVLNHAQQKYKLISENPDKYEQWKEDLTVTKKAAEEIELVCVIANGCCTLMEQLWVADQQRVELKQYQELDRPLVPQRKPELGNEEEECMNEEEECMNEEEECMNRVASLQRMAVALNKGISAALQTLSGIHTRLPASVVKDPLGCETEMNLHLGELSNAVTVLTGLLPSDSHYNIERIQQRLVACERVVTPLVNALSEKITLLLSVPLRQEDEFGHGDIPKPKKYTLKYEVIQVLFQEKAFDQSSMLTAGEIALRAAGPKGNRNNYFAPVRHLKTDGIVETAKGRGGGCRLTAVGRRMAEDMFK